MNCKTKKQPMLCGIVLFALFGVQMIMHLNVDNLLLDDWVFYAVREQGLSIPAWLLERWETWSSRLMIEGVLCAMTHSIWAFRVLDSAAMVLLAWALCRLAGAEKRPGMLAVSALLVTAIPFSVLRSTGWMATSLNYYWPLAATAAALVPLADGLWQRKTGRAMHAAALLCALFGANQEQTSAVLAGSYLVLGGYLYIRSRRIKKIYAVIFAIAAAELVLHLICPGNAVRAQQSVALVNLRDYGQFSLVDKLSIGLTSTTALMFYTFCPVLLVCGVLVGATITARRRGAVAHVLVLAVSAFVLRAYLAYFTQTLSGLAGANRPFLSMLSYTLRLGPEHIGNRTNMIMVFASVMALGLMALALYLSIGHRPLALCAVFVYAVGFAARMALSFSPTVVESGERTMLPLYGAMMLCALLCMRDCDRDGARRWPLLAAVIVCMIIAGMNVLSSFSLAA